MNGRLARACLAAALIGALPPAGADSTLDSFARAAFAEFQKKAPEMSAATGATRTSPTVTGHLAFWQCSDGKTTLTVDLRVMRPTQASEAGRRKHRLKPRR